MNLSKKEAIAKHRAMWTWIAEETVEQERAITKTDYFDEFNIKPVVSNFCYCCSYDESIIGDCQHCPIKWHSNVTQYMCTDMFQDDDDMGFYGLWCTAYKNGEWRTAAKLAKLIANLPEMEG